jgi:hypothetical protein
MLLSGREIPKKMIPFIITFAALIIDYILPEDDLKTLLIFSVLILAFSICRFDSQVPIIFAISLLLITGVLISQQKDDSANRLAVQSYLLLVAGIVCALIELYRKTISNRVAIA